MSASQQGPDAKIIRRLGNGRVKNIIIVLSGKGGVGKSSVAAQLALSISESQTPTTDTPGSSDSASTSRHPKVGILDVDLTGPSIPRMLGLDGQQILQSSDGWVPVYADREQRLAVMSVGFLLRSKNDSVVWRGPKKNAMIKQFLGDVRWGELDYLIIDTPPGTSDEHISLLEYLRPFNPCAVLVTTPQAVSLADNLRSLDFTRKVSLPLVGLIENMSGYVCPHCAECTNVWGKGGGEALAAREGLKFLGRIPIDPGLVRVLDDAKDEAVQRAKVGAPARGEDGEPHQGAGSTPSQREGSRPPMDVDVDVGPEGAKKAKAEEDIISQPLPAPAATSAEAPSQAQAQPQHASASAANPILENVPTQALSTTPAGTLLSRTLLQRYRDSATFPIFAQIAKGALQGVEEHRERVAGTGL